MRLFTIFPVLIVSWLAITATPIQAQMRVAALVNDDIITILDLDQRLKLAAFSSGNNLTRQAMAQLAPQVMQTMINETLIRQAASVQNITIPSARIDEAIADIVARNNATLDSFQNALLNNGIMMQTLRSQIENQLLWQSYLRRNVLRNIEVSDDEVEEIFNKEKALADRPQLQVQEIFIASDNPNGEDILTTLLQEIRAGADFSALARTFSQAPTAKQGGNKGWILPEQQPPLIKEALEELTIGEVSPIVNVVLGSYIFKLLDQRQMTSNKSDLIEIRQLMIASSAQSAPAFLQNFWMLYQDSNDGCNDMQSYMDENENERARMNVINNITIQDLRGSVKSVVAGLSVGEVSAPFQSAGNWLVFALCDKTSNEELENDRKRQIRNSLGNARIQVQERRILRDLRRMAYIDIRI